MRGAGTKMATTRNSLPPVCLDLTRLISRVGRGPMTGIDRVELAYLRKFLEIANPFFGLVRVGRDFYLLDGVGATDVLARLSGQRGWGTRDLRSRLYLRQTKERQAALSDLRRLAVCRSNRAAIAGALRRHCGSGLRYLNVGHSNIDREVFEAVKSVEDAKILVFLHDVIPLEYPQFQRPETATEFETKLKVISELADAVICPSADCQDRSEAYFAKLGRAPNCTFAFLGVDPALPAPEELPANLNLSEPYFVTLGTIEPRKNHALLLDVWQRLSHGPDAPTLFVVGQRGWMNKAVFDRLDAGPANVVELNTLTDGAVTALLQGSRGLLFPSLAEGFGLPPAEAAFLGVPVVCSELSVYHEFLGDYPVYLNATDRYIWETTTRKLSDCRADSNKSDRPFRLPAGLPTWDDHFNTVLKVL